MIAFREGVDRRDLRPAGRPQQTARGRSRAEPVTSNPWIFSGPTLLTSGVPAFQDEHNVEILFEANVPDQVIKDLQRRHILLSRRSVSGSMTERSASSASLGPSTCYLPFVGRRGAIVGMSSFVAKRALLMSGRRR
jgi:hypothetical protein